MPRLVLLVLVFVGFTGWSIWITLQHGYFGFLEVPAGSDWGRQVFTDLVLALSIAWAFMIPDARRHGLNPWPWVIATFAIGSISPLAYLIHRKLHLRRSLSKDPSS